jgi:hypothetical protein
MTLPGKASILVASSCHIDNNCAQRALRAVAAEPSLSFHWHRLMRVMVPLPHSSVLGVKPGPITFVPRAAENPAPDAANPVA